MNKILKWLALLWLTLTAGCAGLTGVATDAALGAVGLGKDKDGLQVDTELVAGDKSQAVQLGETLEVAPKFDEVDLQDSTMNVNTSTTKKRHELNAQSIDYTEGIPYWQAALGGIFLLFIGLFTPQLVVRRK